MFNQLKVEWYKLTRFLWIYVVALIIIAMGFAYATEKLYVYNAIEIFSETVCDTSLVFFITIIVSAFLGMDFTNRTIHNEIKLGYSRLSIILTRLLVVLPFSAIIHLLYIISVEVGRGLKSGFTAELFNMNNAAWLGIVLVQLMAVQSFTVLITFVTKKVMPAITLSVCFTAVTCNTLRNFMTSKIFTNSCFFFVESPQLVPLIVAIITLIVVIILTYLLFRKAEIK